LRPAWGKKLSIPHLKNNLDMMVNACNHSYKGGIDRRTKIPIKKNTETKKGASGTAPE
jgi:hypothetical protein